MGKVRSIFKTTFLLVMFAVGAISIAIERPKTRQARADWLHRFAGRVLSAMGITVGMSGTVPPEGCAVISNHVTYVDIVVYAFLHRCVYVAKAEISKWPVIGWMTTQVGTVFVERGKGGQAAKAGTGIRAATDAGLTVMFFPEGTTGDGLTLLPFRTGLLAQARGENMPVYAAHIRYSMREDNGPNVSVKEDISYYSDTPLGVHIFNFLKLRGVHVEVEFAEEPIAFASVADDRKGTAEEARAAVQALADRA